ncbi:MAG: transglycosylase SLT domain-containing protein [Cytophagaceae bacterium]|nr:transglycosylase SLT domain-containing protein [Cytophagaceae bacterium]MDW8455296.1 transglycosylase SLT domain-containing protein [Cytophagaceae bacterium]
MHTRGNIGLCNHKMLLLVLCTLSTVAYAQYEECIDSLPFQSFPGKAQLFMPQENSPSRLYPKDYVPNEPNYVIEDRLSCLEGDVCLTFNGTVRSFIDYFSIRHRSYLTTMESRRHLYFPVFEEMLKKYGIPDEVKYLAVVESGLNPFAVSVAGAAGLWQFMPATGRQFGLKVNEYIDERLDLYKETEAACKLLNWLYSMYNDWELAMAAYNCGPGYVNRAIRLSGNKKKFWEIYNYLPRETRGYVPQYVAVVYLMNHLEDHNMYPDSIHYPINFDTITVSGFVNFNILCKELNLCYEDFVKLNPAIRTNILPAHMSYTIRIPTDRMADFLMRKEEILSLCKKAPPVIETVHTTRKIKYSGTYATSTGNTTKLYHTVKKGEALSLIASKYGVTINQIKIWNGMKNNYVSVGQKLLIYKTSSGSGNKAAANSYSSQSSATNAKYHYVQPGDTLWTISKKYGGIPIEKLKKMNNLPGDKLKVGQKLRVG